MAIQPFINKPIGGINQNANPNEFPPTDFLDGYDVIDRNPREKNEKTLLQPSNNTVFAYDLGEAEYTRKKYKIFINITGLTTCSIYINVNYKGFYSGRLTVAFTTGDSISTLFNAIVAAFAANTQLSSTTLTYDASSVGGRLVFDATLNYYQYSDYYLTVSNSFGRIYDSQVLFDAVSREKLGIFRPICFFNINNDQQIFATTNQVEPETLEATLSRPVNSIIQITFPSPTAIRNGEEVYIYPKDSVVGDTFVGNGTLTQVSLDFTVYSIDGSLNPFTATILSSGNYYVVRHNRTLSAIGYAQKNEVSKIWNYTELVRSNKLNFRIYKQIEGRLDITSDGIIYNFSDFLNTIKRLIYVNGSVGIMNGGFLTVYNSSAYYNLDTIEDESNLQLGTNTSKVTLSIGTTTSSRTGVSIGSKQEGCYAAFIRFKTNDGAYTTYSKASNVLWLHSSSIYDHRFNSNSGMAIDIKVEQIPFDKFSSIQVSIIEFTDSAWKGYSLPEVPINGKETVYISDSGFNSQSYLNFDDAGVLLEQIPFVFENSRSLLGYNNYMIAACVNLYREYDLTAWAQTIDLEVKRREINVGDNTAVYPIQNTSTTILLGINNYAQCSNEWMSYMPHDHYRFCVFIDWKNGSPTSTYWIDDVSFDPTDTGLTDDVCGSLGTTLFVYQYYIEASEIDIDYRLPDGKLLREVIKDIRFGRALCNKQVQTTGFGIGVFNDGTDDYVSFGDDGANTIVLDKLALYSPDYQNTSNIFNWQSGDVLRAKQAYRVGGAFYATSNKAYPFTQDIGSLVSASITRLENTATGGDSDIALFSYLNVGNQISIRGGAAVELGSSLSYPSAIDLYYQNFYYLRPYGPDGAYPQSPEQTRFFIVPQSAWFDIATHTTATTYNIYGGDCFPTISSYKTAENTTNEIENNLALSFYSFNRTNAGLRSGSFPYVPLETYLAARFLTETRFAEFPNDLYTYDGCFTPRYLFQNQVAFNPLLPQITNKFSSIYYSGVGFGGDLAGGNRIWLPLDTKQLESKYGAIVHMEVLFGLSGQNILMVWQERRFTAQYFDNTANIISNSGQLLVGSGKILERTGQDLTEFGCEYKWLIKKGKSETGKDLAFSIDFRKGAIMRFGADGTSNIIGNISQLINNDTYLAILNQYANSDTPAQFFGCHATWDNINMEYIVTIRLAAKGVTDREFGDVFQKGEIKYSTTEFWGFEQFPIIYKSLIDGNTSTPPNSTWETISGYDSEYFEILTLVWNEKDNKFKTPRTFTPKIYGQWNNTILSSHPVNNNLIYEHNAPLNEALYYEVETTTAVTATTDPILFRITGTGIESTFPSPFTVADRAKYVVKIDGKNYEVVGAGTNYLQMANVDTDDILPQVTIENFSYFYCNSQDPYITTLASNGGGRYFHFAVKEVQSDDTLKRTEYEAGYSSLATPTTKSFTNKIEEDFDNGKSNVQIKQDTTNDPTDNEVSLNSVEGFWLKVKSIWRWGKKNRVQTIEIQALETQKTK